MNEDEKYMRRALQLARNGICTTSPNPMVGAVIVCDGKIIGEGYHIRCGCSHAEVNAVRSVADQSLLVRSTIYVTLEPCSHYGKTPPCADMLIEKGIPRIVIGCEDPFAKVNGRGIQKLKDAGREVVVGVLEAECRQLIRRFVTFNTLFRPYIILKWAESADGFIGKKGERTQISPLGSMLLSHKRRAECDAVLVGTETARVDNPSLTVREWYGSNPIRVVMDSRFTLSQSLHVYDGTVPTLIFTSSDPTDKDTYREKKENVEYIRTTRAEFTAQRLMAELHKYNIQSLIIEGGAHIHRAFIEASLWDEAYVEKSTTVLHDGVEAARLTSFKSCTEIRFMGTSILHYYRT